VTSLIATSRLSRRYPIGDIDVDALIDISFCVEQGEAVAIMGPSGSGKSTLLNVLGCLDAPSSGSYMLDGTDVSSLSMSQMAALRRQQFGFVFQNFNLLARATAFENIELPLIYAGGCSRAARHERVTQLLELVGLDDRAQHLPSQLSGGQQQRVAIARALANKPKIIMADEPTGALDTAVSQTIMTMLQEINASGVTLLLVTHDPEVATAMRRIVTLKDGRVISDASSTVGQVGAAQ
jgi:putative ABC transport system ATP-binding protein